MDIKAKRKKFMNHLCGNLDIIDPTGKNAEKYQNFFNKMSDKEIDKYLKDFFSDEKNIFYLESVEYVNDLKLENIKKAAEAIHLPLFERVVLPHVNGDPENAMVTPHPVPVGPIHLKLMVQMLLEKNNTSTGIQHRSSKTGTVTGDDKASRISDVESYSMITLGAEQGLKELLGPRADNEMTKQQMYQAIANDGEVSLEDLESSQKSKVALRTLDVYHNIQMLKTNLIDDSDIL